MNLHDATACQHPTNSSRQTRETTGGFIIDSQNREIPITEEMIRQACRSLLEAERTQAQSV
ncbi:PA1571 family protein [Pseudomonas sp. NCCP-436]|uniref:PA1571 family protein n=1 Tax=Pseudomonas sp. NCCP-436 TaxID=2842481 RepID=UPI001C800F20|nr:PA1571 family protein [Pseudomonas sp. NCCP-436]GIZ11848.1 hypothetical protein NCCP436_12640 [Pseudomonas sp. NCCP-436]